MAKVPVLIRPVLSEKALRQKDEQNWVFFHVRLDADKKEIAEALKQRYALDALQVRTCIMPTRPKVRRGKTYRRPKWKKAMIRVEDASKLNFLAS
jgi:large subunit ribosomal protein L23